MAASYKYFLYSATQYKARVQIEKNMKKQYIPGKVLVRGQWKDYTEISNNPSNNRFSDTIIITEGYIDNINYTKSRSMLAANN